MIRYIEFILLLLLVPLILSAQETFSVRGYVFDSQSGETLIGASISSGENFVISNSYGFFSINAEIGAVISVSYVGYESRQIEVKEVPDTLLNVQLKQTAIINEAYVTAEANSAARSSFTGVLNIPVKQIKAVPALLGESDIIKVLQKTPGVQTGMEGFTGLYVRGGGAEENLQLYDGVPLYNVSHMLGLLSVYTPEAIKNVTFFKGSFPARYGGRVSSIIDVRTNDGNCENLSGIASIGLLTCKLHLEGPLSGKNTTFSLSARATPTMLFDRLLLKKTGYGYYFYDLNGKLSHKFNNSDRLTFSVYHGRDNYNSMAKDSLERGYHHVKNNCYYIQKEIVSNDLNYMWSNSMAAIRWNHAFSSNMFADCCISWTDYHSVKHNYSKTSDIVKELDLRESLEISNLSKSCISDFNADISFEYSSCRSNLMTFGFQTIYHRFTPRSRIASSASSGEIYDSEHVSYENGYTCLNEGIESALYYEDDICIAKRIKINTGIRSTLFYTQSQPYYVLEPRASAQYIMNESTSIKLGYSRMSQYVHLLCSSSMNLPTDLWVPVTKDISPVISSIMSIGVYQHWGKGWASSVEGYWKRIHNVLEFKDGKAFLSSSDWANSVSSGEGLSKGIELLIEKKLGKTTGWFAYTLSKSVRWFPDKSVNNGKVFPYNYDRRHNLNFCARHEFNEKLVINASWTYYSGNMMTLPDRVAMIYGINTISDVPYVMNRNNYRLPPTHHLDLSADFRKKKKTGMRVWTFGVYNAYGRKNPNLIDQYIDFVDFASGSKETRLVVSKVTLFMFVPSISYTFSF